MMTEQHECEWEMDAWHPKANCLCGESMFPEEIERRLNEYETLIAEVAGMRDKWTPPDEVVELESENEALRKEIHAGRVLDGWTEEEIKRYMDNIGKRGINESNDALLTTEAIRKAKSHADTLKGE